MRRIEKAAGATCLHAARAGAPVTGYVWQPEIEGCPDEIRQRLVEEQGAICAYCMQRIKPHGYRDGRPGDGGMKIEHWLDRSKNEERMYDWDNLLGVCGGEYVDARGKVEHCDKSRQALDLYVHPATDTAPRPETVMAFERRPPGGGSPPFPGVWIHGKTDEARSDIDTLNLNAEHLVRNRREAVDAVDMALRNARNDSAARQILRAMWREVTASTGDLPVFARLVREHVEKKMRRYGMS